MPFSHVHTMLFDNPLAKALYKLGGMGTNLAKDLDQKAKIEKKVSCHEEDSYVQKSAETHSQVKKPTLRDHQLKRSIERGRMGSNLVIERDRISKSEDPAFCYDQDSHFKKSSDLYSHSKSWTERDYQLKRSNERDSQIIKSTERKSSVKTDELRRWSLRGSFSKRGSQMGKTSSKLPPKEITDLLNLTHFTEQELKDWHIGFKRDCPEGRLSLQQFTDIYSKFYGTTEAKKFAEHLFRTFDTNHDGTIDFREFMCSLSITTRGTMEEKLRWAFMVYDVDGNGSITSNEVLAIVKSIKKMIGNINDKNASDERILSLFSKFDKNHDNKLSLQEFVEGAQNDLTFVRILQSND
ncbi:neurocalcin homolog isoform X2 [Hydra vulgaris]|uniref:neurocalcin homolog isoform X2 n=2 Tax=Hydra vulgaris TaxID=6087 RepID=UPI000640D342|nr:neurocalcin homolog isoform X1 [Hydra vulgaris]